MFTHDMCMWFKDSTYGLDRDILLPISYPDLDVIKPNGSACSRFGMANGLSILTAPVSSLTTSMCSRPTSPCSCAPSSAASASELSGYSLPPESITRRSTWDKREASGLRKSLPSIHEALGDIPMSLSNSLSLTSQQLSLSTPTTAASQSFPEGAELPDNTIPQHPGPEPGLRNVFLAPPKNDSMLVYKPSMRSTKPMSQRFDHREFPPPQPPPPAIRSSSLAFRSLSSHNDHPATSPQSFDAPKPPLPLPLVGAKPTSNGLLPHVPVPFCTDAKADLQQPAYPRVEDVHFGDSLSRHPDVFNAELGFNKVKSCLVSHTGCNAN